MYGIICREQYLLLRLLKQSRELCEKCLDITGTGRDLGFLLAFSSGRTPNRETPAQPCTVDAKISKGYAIKSHWLKWQSFRTSHAPKFLMHFFFRKPRLVDELQTVLNLALQALGHHSLPQSIRTH